MDITTSLFSPANEITTQGVDLSSNNKAGTFLQSKNDEIDLEQKSHDDNTNVTRLLPQDGNNLPEHNVQVAFFGEILKDNLNKIQGENALKKSDDLEKSELQIVDEIDEPVITINDFLYSEVKQISDVNIVSKYTIQDDNSKILDDLKPIMVKEQTLANVQNEIKESISVAMLEDKSQKGIQNEIEYTNDADFSSRLSSSEIVSMSDTPENTEQKFSEDQDSEEYSFELLQKKNIESNHENDLDIKQEINKALMSNNNNFYEKNTDNEELANVNNADKSEINAISEDNPVTSQLVSPNNDVVKKYSITDSRVKSDGVIAKETFEQDLSEKIQLMVNAKENTATVNVEPAELGQIEIRIIQEADKTHIVFHAHLEQTQDLIESNLFKLRAQMEFQGLHLGDVSVFNGNSDNQQQYKMKNSYPTAHFSDTGDEQDKGIQRASLSMLDLYV